MRGARRTDGVERHAIGELCEHCHVRLRDDAVSAAALRGEVGDARHVTVLQRACLHRKAREHGTRLHGSDELGSLVVDATVPHGDLRGNRESITWFLHLPFGQQSTCSSLAPFTRSRPQISLAPSRHTILALHGNAA